MMARGGSKKTRRSTAAPEERRRRRTRGQGQKQLKKDPGIPNVAVFKERAHREAEKRKQRMEEQAKRQKAARAQNLVQRRSLEGLQQDAQKRQLDFEQMVSQIRERAAGNRDQCRGGGVVGEREWSHVEAQGGRKLRGSLWKGQGTGLRWRANVVC
ncbi:guanine nucleotide-binding protein-like 3, partial [Rhincodon typus]|uniref:guanine nucleotide-binding protein-like 3 n=1 Tax=Rhincodon typus TaxID=259920 RepID=UPI00202E58A4